MTDPTVTLADLGLKPVINASATLTTLGGSLMPPEVVAAMIEGSKSFVDWPNLQRAVGRRIAEITHNEACYISSGAAAGIVAAVASILTGGDPEKVAAFPHLTGFDRTEIIVFRSQRNGYDYAARQTGASFVEIGDSLDEFQAALGGGTAAVLWFAGRLASTSPDLSDIVALAHRHNVPVIVDAAAQIPTVENFWRFTRDLGADVAIFSGGKGIRGPQSSGLVLGRPDIIEGCLANGSPYSTIGRPMKVGKEELFGILAAVEWTLAQDEDAAIARYEHTVQVWLSALSEVPGVVAERGFPSEAGQPMPRAIVTLGEDARMRAPELVAALWNQDPAIAVSQIGEDAFALNPQTLEDGQDVLIAEAIRALLEPHD